MVYLLSRSCDLDMISVLYRAARSEGAVPGSALCFDLFNADALSPR